MADETREQVLREREPYQQSIQKMSDDEIIESLRLKAVMARIFYHQLVGQGFSEQAALIITAGQRFNS